MLGTDRDAADGSQLTAHSLRLSDSDSGRSAVSRWPLARIIGNLYYPDSPYEFSVMPADVLGQVYEQFLGKVIRLTAGHQAKVEERSKGLVPARALDGPSAPRKLFAMQSEPRPALTEVELFIMSPELPCPRNYPGRSGGRKHWPNSTRGRLSTDSRLNPLST